MKKIFVFLIFVLSIDFSVCAQYVEVPDLDFRSYLIEKYPICFNSENQLDTTCYEVMVESSMIFGSENVKQNIMDLDGIQYFKSITTLSLNNMLINSLDDIPPSLNYLSITNCKISVVDDLPNSIEELFLDNNYIKEIKSLPTALKSLNINNNRVTKLPDVLPVDLNVIYAQGNYFSSIPNLPNVETIFFEDQKKYLPVEEKSYIELPDTTFAKILSYQFPACFNNQKQLDTNCADIKNVKIYSLGNEFENVRPYSEVNPHVEYIYNIEGIQYFKSLEKLDLIGQRITLLKNIPNTVKSLSIMRNNLLEVQELPDSLEYLDISDNRLSKLPKPLPSKINSLFAIKNCFTEFPQKPVTIKENGWYFDDQWEIKTNLSPAYVAMNDSVFRERLKWNFSMAFNEKNEIDTTNLHIRNVKEIYLETNRQSDFVITNVDELRFFENLESLSLSGICAKKIPSLSKKLETLNVYDCLFESYEPLPNSIKNLVLKNNKLVNFEAWPESIESVDISYNKISSLPTGMPSGLTSLIANNNSFDVIPSVPSSFIGDWLFEPQWGYKSNTLPHYINITDTLAMYQIRNLYKYCFDNNNRMDVTCNYIENAKNLTLGNVIYDISNIWSSFKALENLKLVEIKGINSSTVVLEGYDSPITIYENVLNIDVPTLVNLEIIGTISEIRTLPSNLKKLFIRSNNLRIGQLPSSLEELIITGITDFDLDLPKKLKKIIISGRVNSIINSMPDSLESFEYYGIDRNPFNNLDFSNTKLTYLIISGPDLESEPTLPQSVKVLKLERTKIETITFIPDSVEELSLMSNTLLSNLPFYELPKGLKHFDVRQTALKCMPKLPESLEILYFESDSIKCLPNISRDLKNVPVYPICNTDNNLSFCQSLPTVSGFVYLDENKNNVFDVGERVVSEAKLTLSNGVTTFTNSFGFYQFTLQDTVKTYSLKIHDIDNYIILNPLRNVDVESLNTSKEESFGLIPLEENVVQFIAQLSTLSQYAKSDFDFSHRLLVTNTGTVTSDAYIKLKTDKDVYSVNTVSPDFFIIEEDSLTGIVTNLKPLETQVIFFDGKLNSDAVFGDSLITYSWVYDSNKHTVLKDSVVVTIRDFLNHNNKQATPMLLTKEGSNEAYIDYTINFQNEGTDTVFSVMIIDTLSDHLDLSSLEIIGKSHNCNITLKNNLVTFQIDNVLMTDSTINERDRYGFVSFRIKPVINIQDNQLIENKASIYFNFNNPIITNNTTTVINSKGGIVSVENDEEEGFFLMYPSPSESEINISIEKPAYIEVSIVDLLGQEVLTDSLYGESIRLDVSSLPKKLYVVRVKHNGLVLTSKFLKI